MEFHSQAGGRFTLTQTLCSSSGEEFTMQPFRWDFVGKNMVFMAVEGFVYFILNLLMQYQFFSGRWYEKSISTFTYAAFYSIGLKCSLLWSSV